MPRLVALHRDGQRVSVDADDVEAVAPAQADNVNAGSILRFKDGTLMRVDEAVSVVRLVLERTG